MALSKYERRKRIKKMGNENFGKYQAKMRVEKELTYVMIKPEVACYQNKVWDIISMIKKAGLKIELQSTEFLKREKVANHYIHLADKPFYKDLLDYMTSDIVVKLIVSGKNSVQVMRNLCGPTNPEKAMEGTIRKKYGKNIQMNAVHASATIEEAKSEIRNHYESEIVEMFRNKGFEL